jgi:hypothetical protein
MQGMKTPIEIVPMSDIIDSYNPGPGRHWFDPSTKRFFRSRLPQYGFKGPGGTFFVSSEQFVGSHGERHARRYTVRQLTSDSIKTVGEFNVLSKSAANTLARKSAEGIS